MPFYQHTRNMSTIQWQRKQITSYISDFLLFSLKPQSLTKHLSVYIKFPAFFKTGITTFLLISQRCYSGRKHTASQLNSARQSFMVGNRVKSIFRVSKTLLQTHPSFLCYCCHKQLIPPWCDKITVPLTPPAGFICCSLRIGL